ncbi:hypothetical protein DMUE_5200, partial [Dictyocoela muelleri]
IIHSFKSIYKSNINNFLINSLDFKERDGFHINNRLDLYTVFFWIHKAYNMIAKETINNCWNKAFKKDSSEIKNDNNEEEVKIIINETNISKDIDDVIENEEAGNLSEIKLFEYMNEIERKL